MDRKLKVVLVAVDQSFDLDVVILLESIERIGDVVPHLGFNLAASICQSQRQIGITGLFRLHLFNRDHKARRDYLVVATRAIGDIKVLHGAQREPALHEDRTAHRMGEELEQALWFGSAYTKTAG